MAAYDLRVQKPASLAIPDSPGANDLARFLSVSESSRANREKEELNQNIFDWEKGAGQRKLTAEEAERERVRQQNMDLSNALTGTTEGYMTNAKENYRLADDAVAEFRKRFPNATEDQVNNVKKASRERVTQNPNYYIDPKEMTRQLQSTLMSEQGLGYEEAQKAAADQVGSYFTTPKGPNEKILEARIDLINNGGFTDKGSYSHNGSSGSGSNGSRSKGSEEFRKGVKFVTDNQLNNPNNSWEPGSKGLLDFDLPWNNDQIYTDDVENMTQAAQLERGVQPQYVIAALQSLSRDGELPDGYSSEDMRDTKSEFYNDVVSSAGEIQQYFESQQNNGTGGNGNGMSPEQWRQARQGDLEMKNNAFNQLEALYQKSGGGPLSSEEQFQIMSDPELLEQFGIAIQQSVENNGGSKSDKKKVAAVVNSAKTEKAEVSKDDSAAVEDGDNPDLKSLIEGENKDDQPTEEELLKAISNTPVSNSSGAYKSRDELVAIQELINKVNSGNATQAEKSSLIDIYSDTSLEIEVDLPESLKDITFSKLRSLVPEGADRQKIYDLYRKGRAGNASKSEMKELMSALNSAKK